MKVKKSILITFSKIFKIILLIFITIRTKIPDHYKKILEKKEKVKIKTKND